MKNLKILVLLFFMWGFTGLISMKRKLEEESLPEKQIQRPKKTDQDVQNLGQLGQLPDDAILNIILQVLNQTDPQKAYQDLVNFGKTNKYINQLIKAASTEGSDFAKRVKYIKEEVVKIIGLKKDIKFLNNLDQEEPWIIREYNKRWYDEFYYAFMDNNLDINVLFPEDLTKYRRADLLSRLGLFYLFEDFMKDFKKTGNKTYDKIFIDMLFKSLVHFILNPSGKDKDYINSNNLKNNQIKILKFLLDYGATVSQAVKNSMQQDPDLRSIKFL